MSVARHFSERLSDWKMLWCHLSFIASGVVLAGGMAHAASTEDELFFSELPIVASVSRLPQRQQDAPTSVTTLDRATIKASGMRDLNDLLRLVPGFQTFSHTTDPVRVTYHGITDDDFSPRVQVLIDGRSLYSPLFRGGVNWTMLPVAIEDIERIEVVRGTNSASYGTNAFLGVINIITVDSALMQRGISTNLGNQGVRDYTLRTGGKLGEVGNFRFTYQKKDDNALNDRANWHDSYRSRLFDLRADFQLTTRDSLQANLGHTEATMPMGVNNDPGWPIHDFDQSSSYLQLGWRHVVSESSDLNIRFAYSRDRADDRFIGTFLVNSPMPDPSDLLYRDGSFGGSSIRHEIEVQHTFRPLDDLRLAWGGGYRRDELQSGQNFYGNPRYVRSVSRAFGNAEWKPLKWFSGNLGASLDYDTMAGHSVSPRASVAFHMNPDNTIRLGVAKTVRTVSTMDYKGDFRYEAFQYRDGTTIAPGTIYQYGFYGDAHTPAEKLHSFDIGYLGEWRNLRMSLDVRAFREVIPNRLMRVSRSLEQYGVCDFRGCTDTTADFLTPVQHVRIQGVEYQWRWQPRETTRLIFSQSFTEIRAEVLDGFLNSHSLASGGALGSDNLQTNDKLAEMSAPKRATSLLWIEQLPYGFLFSAFGQYQSKMKWTRNSEAEGYSRVDLRLAYPFRWGDVRGEIAGTVQSLNGPHGEFRAIGQTGDRIVTHREWLTVRFDY
jgi:iron complex outermembrane receptor protein